MLSFETSRILCCSCEGVSFWLVVSFKECLPWSGLTGLTCASESGQDSQEMILQNTKHVSRKLQGPGCVASWEHTSRAFSSNNLEAYSRRARIGSMNFCEAHREFWSSGKALATGARMCVRNL